MKGLGQRRGIAVPGEVQPSAAGGGKGLAEPWAHGRRVGDARDVDVGPQAAAGEAFPLGNAVGHSE